jgi:hypothetical protein
MSGAHIRANEVQKTTEPVRQPGREIIRRHEQGPVQAEAPQVAYRRVQLNRNGLRPADLLALQRTVGNRALQRMVAKANDEQQDENTAEDSKRTVQTKLTVGAPSDLYEQGADRVAGQMMTLPEAATQRPNRTGLPDGLKSGIESLSGMSMDNVKVHYNSAQPAELNALAYTQGSDIHVAPGQERHLPHEAWHVVQQARGRVQPTFQMKDGVPVNGDEGLEHEADVMGAEALAPAAQLTGGPEEEELLQGKLAPAQRTAREQGGAMAHTTKSPWDDQRGRPAAQHPAASSAAMVVDNRPEAVAQRELADAVNRSPRLIAQQASIRAVLSSPRVTAQRSQFEGLFEAAQLRSDPANASYRLPVNDDTGLELEADAMGAQALRTTGYEPWPSRVWTPSDETAVQLALDSKKLNLVGDDHGDYKAKDAREHEANFLAGKGFGPYSQEGEFKVGDLLGDSMALKLQYLMTRVFEAIETIAEEKITGNETKLSSLGFQSQTDCANARAIVSQGEKVSGLADNRSKDVSATLKAIETTFATWAQDMMNRGLQKTLFELQESLKKHLANPEKTASDISEDRSIHMHKVANEAVRAKMTGVWKIGVDHVAHLRAIDTAKYGEAEYALTSRDEFFVEYPELRPRFK